MIDGEKARKELKKDAPTTSQQRIAEKLSIIEVREKGQKVDTQKE